MILICLFTIKIGLNVSEMNKSSTASIKALELQNKSFVFFKSLEMVKTLGFCVCSIVNFLIVGCIKVIPIIYEDHELCVEPENNAGKFDWSNMEIIAESDTAVFLNGSLHILKKVDSPWKSTVFTERFLRGKWNVEALHKKIPDFCAVLQDPLTSWYHITSQWNPKNCPYEAGVSLKLNNLFETSLI